MRVLFYSIILSTTLLSGCFGTFSAGGTNNGRPFNVSGSNIVSSGMVSNNAYGNSNPQQSNSLPCPQGMNQVGWNGASRVCAPTQQQVSNIWLSCPPGSYTGGDGKCYSHQRTVTPMIPPPPRRMQ